SEIDELGGLGLLTRPRTRRLGRMPARTFSTMRLERSLQVLHIHELPATKARADGAELPRGMVLQEAKVTESLRREPRCLHILRDRLRVQQRDDASADLSNSLTDVFP